jgi:predicted PurR-regulated permease PerM
MIQKKITFDSFIRGILTAMVIIGILYLVNRLSGVLLPFFIAWLIAYLTYPMVIFFQNKLLSFSASCIFNISMCSFMKLATVPGIAACLDPSIK